MNALLDQSSLNPRCRADLRRLLNAFEANSRSVASGKTIYDHNSLPRCVNQLTSSKAGITKPPMFRPSTAGKALHIPSDWTNDASLEQREQKFFKSVDERLKEQATSTPKKRNGALPLSAKEQDFIYRYAEYKHGSKVSRGEEAHQKSLAYRAYTEAFLSFMNRPPSVAELQEADRLSFVQDGPRVGIVSQPHAPTPHHHISNSTDAVTACSRQVHQPKPRVERAARAGSTLLDRTSFSAQQSPQSSPSRQRGTHSAAKTLEEAPQSELPPLEHKKYCQRCSARLPPRLVKNICPACDAK